MHPPANALSDTRHRTPKIHTTNVEYSYLNNTWNTTEHFSDISNICW